jgi:cation diffusion facilitator CzcD-associated flavoprotein CzcO
MDSQAHFDILIIGAGISGIDAAYPLQTAFPRKTYSILEAREAIGGTWDLFRYPPHQTGTSDDASFLSSADARWTVEAQTKDGRMVRLVCNFLYMCSGPAMSLPVHARTQRPSGCIGICQKGLPRN